MAGDRQFVAALARQTWVRRDGAVLPLLSDDEVKNLKTVGDAVAFIDANAG